ncbi:ribosomal protein S18-alanine N-acetyltransferase [Lactovum miscens]|uniref:[Ribosomal protein bS18]-alanine N-acetyltransferase n=1 Tax=Lactovum miscens TaxID=190387 RepID=A0A841C8X9_9LACT|nr:ribosomal protein S18-alanine N-acetyltransferase [Lactovum miscens]MBB5888011.1 ribosomal-protein-alanine N-acetyltransferase [Lactovum miscens]
MRIKNNRLVANCNALAKEIYNILSSNYEKSPWTLKQIKDDMNLPSSLYFLAYDDKKNLVGFMATVQVVDETEITNIAVSSDSQRQGIAEALLSQLNERQGILFLEVREGNFPARRLYQKLGFEEFNRRKSYYSNPVEDALLMKKEQFL